MQARFIAVSMNNEDNFLNLIAENLEAEVDKRGDTIFVNFAEKDFNTQLAQIKSYVRVGADAIIIVPVSTNQADNQQLIDAAGNIPVVFLNNEPFPNLADLPKGTAYVGSNEEESGTLEMEALAKMANYQGKVAMLMGEKGHTAARMRSEDVRRVLAKYPNMQLVASEHADWQRNRGFQITNNWLKSNLDFNILVANNDEMAIGGIMALKGANIAPSKVLTGGVDGTQDALREMEEGQLDATVLQDAKGQAKAAVETCYRFIEHLPVTSPHWVPFQLITKENFRSYLAN
ncbi:substrate-binding domain-containing protein [Gallaecimonas mangrovi]|uniref:substrate-binding domain-containing protein n=1 Tax=Gallaecimonas mangrovi TaxID=2291597 RepID=UPI0018673E30|nr:substrate-binding domain-containing protein [Gallaecimonas mangrovi]